MEPPAGIEPATPSLPWNHQEPLCEPPFPQVTPDRQGRRYRFSFATVMRSLSSRVLVVWPASQQRRLKRRSTTRWMRRRHAAHRGVGESPTLGKLHSLLSAPEGRPWPPKQQAPVAGATSSVLQPVQDLPVDPSSPVGSLVTALYRILLSASWPRGVVPSPHPDRRSVSS